MSREIGISILLSAVTSDKTPKSVLTAVELARKVLGLQYSRKDEQEADLVSLEYLFKTGYNPCAVVEAMRTLEQKDALRPIDFLSSHPAPQNRIAYLTRKTQTNYYNLAAAVSFFS